MYKLIKTPANFEYILRVADGACIPFDEGNTDYQKYLQWLSEGNEPTPPDEVTE